MFTAIAPTVHGPPAAVDCVAADGHRLTDRDRKNYSMALSLNKPKLDNLANEIWKSAERLRGKFKAYEYQSVILPIIVVIAAVMIDRKSVV